jgi:hypothetical protein
MIDWSSSDYTNTELNLFYNTVSDDGVYLNNTYDLNNYICNPLNRYNGENLDDISKFNNKNTFNGTSTVVPIVTPAMSVTPVTAPVTDFITPMFTMPYNKENFDNQGSKFNIFNSNIMNIIFIFIINIVFLIFIEIRLNNMYNKILSFKNN